MARRSWWRPWIFSESAIAPLLAGRRAVMAVILLGGRQGPTGKLTEQHGNPPAGCRRQPRPGHDRRWGSLSHGAVRSSGPAPATPPAPAGAAASLQIALQTSLRGEMENLVKLHKAQLASDRTSCRSPLANQVRLVLDTAAYWLLLSLRDQIPRTHELASAEFATLRLRVLKVAGRVIETASRVRIAFAAACPHAVLFRGLARSFQPAGP